MIRKIFNFGADRVIGTKNAVNADRVEVVENKR